MQIADCRLMKNLQSAISNLHCNTRIRRHDAIPQSLFEKRRIRIRQPRVRTLVPGAHRVGRRQARPAEAADCDLSARRRRRPQRRRAVRRERVLPREAEHCDRATQQRRECRNRSRWFFRIQPAPSAAEGAVGFEAARRGARVRIARQHAVALRRAGLHGDGDARRESTSDGWLNRYLRARKDEQATPFRAVALTTQLPRMLQGPAPALAMNQIAQFGIRGGQATGSVGASFEAEYASAADQVLNGTGREAFNAIRMLNTTDPSKYEPANGAAYPRSPFGRALEQIAQLTKAGVGLEVAFADIGGWDTHVNQGAAQGQ